MRNKFLLFISYLCVIFCTSSLHELNQFSSGCILIQCLMTDSTKFFLIISTISLITALVHFHFPALTVLELSTNLTQFSTPREFHYPSFERKSQSLRLHMALELAPSHPPSHYWPSSVRLLGLWTSSGPDFPIPLALAQFIVHI